jgi:hypothetical protein
MRTVPIPTTSARTMLDTTIWSVRGRVTKASTSASVPAARMRR